MGLEPTLPCGKRIFASVQDEIRTHTVVLLRDLPPASWATWTNGLLKIICNCTFAIWSNIVPKPKRYSDLDVINNCKSSTSFRQVLTKLGLNETGGNYKSIQKLIRKLEIDISHFTNQGWRKNRTFQPKRELSEYFSNSFPIQSHKMRLRLIKEGYKEAKCEWCNLTEWRGEPMPLELDHIDGNHNNNLLENLRILCPNCHYQTPTHRGNNKKKVALLGIEPNFED